MMLLVFGAGCTSDQLDMGLNGDARLRTLDVKDAHLIPDFDPLENDYEVLVDDINSAKILVVPYIAATEFRINGELIKMATNRYKMPDYTEISTILQSTNKLFIKTTAEDGLQRQYTLTFLSAANDAGISSITTESGVLFPGFEEGQSPEYETVTLDKATNVYRIEANASNFNVIVTPRRSNSSLTAAAGGSATVNVVSNTLELTIPNDGTTNTIYVTNVSSTGRFTNVKQLQVYFQDASKDDKATDIKVFDNSGSQVSYLPRFEHTTYAYPLTLEVEGNSDQLTFVVDKSQASQKVLFYKDAVLVQEVTNAYSSVTNTPITVEMGTEVKVEVVSADDSLSKSYTYTVTMFTRTPYGFDGNIGNLHQTIDALLEWDNSSSNPAEHTHPSQEDIYITGIVTYDYGLNNSYYIEDGAYGVFVWTYWSKPSDLKVGQKVRIQVQGAKYWFGFAEVTRVPSSGGVVILDGGKRYPLYFRDANKIDCGNILNARKTSLRYQAQMFRFTADSINPVMTGWDDSGWGNFSSKLRYRVTNPDRVDIDLLSRTKYPILDYMDDNVTGHFYGPIYYSSSDGAAMEMSTLNYVRDFNNPED